MATGFQGSADNQADVFVLLTGVTAANTVALTAVTLAEAPTANQYLDLRPYRRTLGSIPDEADIVIYSTAGSGTMTLGISQLFVCSAVSLQGGPLGTGASDTTKGAINAGTALGETSADRIFHRQRISGLSGVDGVQLQLGAIGGTATALTVELHFPRCRRLS